MLPMLDGVPVSLSRVPIVRWIRLDEQHFKDWISEREFVRGVRYAYVVSIDYSYFKTDDAMLRLNDQQRLYLGQQSYQIIKTTYDNQ